MTNGNTKIISEVLVNPLSQIIKEVGISISETQQAMDRNSIDTQLAIENDELLSQYDIQATWHHIPEVELELKMALTMKYREEKDSKGLLRGYRPVLYAAPLNASYKNLHEYDVDGASTIKARFVSVPPSSQIVNE
ncbi:MAG: hypothetical protein IBX39_05460 [Candidatus Methanoperedenaceae archaeon]|nr:hypothetical protein [Candidatus Methanoperedenaceae archaeon]